MLGLGVDDHIFIVLLKIYSMQQEHCLILSVLRFQFCKSVFTMFLC